MKIVYLKAIHQVVSPNPILKLRSCGQLVDVSALGSLPTLHTINLFGYDKLKGVSALGISLLYE